MKKRAPGKIFAALITVSLIFLLTACSSWKKITSWLPFTGNNQPRYSLTDKDIKKFTSTIKTNNSAAESHYRLGCFYQENKKHRLAVQEFKKALQNDPTYVKAYNGLGVSYDFLGDFSSAGKAYDTALRLNPNLAYVHNNIGYSYLLQGKFDLAVNAFQHAVSLDQENRQYHNNLALTYGKQGKFDLAFNEFKRGDNEQEARRRMARLFNYTPNENSSPETSVAVNLPQNDIQEADKEKPAQTVLFDKGILEETIAASPSENIPQQKNKEAVEAQKVIISQKIEPADQPSFPVEPAQNSATNHPQAQKVPNALSRIQISNGNGIRHFARNVGSYLTQRGFQVASLQNESRFTVKRTTIYCCEGYLQDACRVAEQIPHHQDIVEVKRFKNPGIKIRVVIGHDMASYYTGYFLNAEPLRSL